MQVVYLLFQWTVGPGEMDSKQRGRPKSFKTNSKPYSQHQSLRSKRNHMSKVQNDKGKPHEGMWQKPCFSIEEYKQQPVEGIMEVNSLLSTTPGWGMETHFKNKSMFYKTLKSQDSVFLVFSHKHSEFSLYSILG